MTFGADSAPWSLQCVQYKLELNCIVNLHCLAITNSGTINSVMHGYPLLSTIYKMSDRSLLVYYDTRAPHEYLSDTNFVNYFKNELK